MAKGTRRSLLWYLCAQRGGGKVWSVWRGETGHWGRLSVPSYGRLLWEIADHVFTDGLHCSRHWRRDTRDKQVLSGGLLLCLGVPGCVVQASLCGCD